jgi:hypothetical protein
MRTTAHTHAHMRTLAHAYALPCLHAHPSAHLCTHAHTFTHMRTLARPHTHTNIFLKVQNVKCTVWTKYAGKQNHTEPAVPKRPPAFAEV